MHHVDSNEMIREKASWKLQKAARWSFEKKFWKRRTTKQQFYGNLPPILQNNQVKRQRHAAQSRIKKEKFINDIR